jgi:hypothetical protein
MTYQISGTGITVDVRDSEDLSMGLYQATVADDGNEWAAYADAPDQAVRAAVCLYQADHQPVASRAA